MEIAMRQNTLGNWDELRRASLAPRGVLTAQRQRVQPARALLAAIGVSVVCALPVAADAENCRLHYAEAFQLIANQRFGGQSPDAVRQTVDDLFGPRQEVCGEVGYKFFLTELGNQATTALHQKGSEQEARLSATREILNRFPRQVRFSNGADPRAGLNQLRSNLGVLSAEVGVTPSVKALLDALAKIAPPQPAPKPLPKDDDAIPITVPRIPLPAWAVISLYEIRDHAARKESAAITAKSNLILDWIARAGPGPRLIESPTTGAAPAKQL
jgi:hypothetical protein